MNTEYKLQSYLPNLYSLISEGPKLWRTELSAGITTAALLIPQSMAYAMLAGLPAQVGLYAALMPIIAYTLLGSAKNLSVGPVAMDSLLTMVTLNGVAMSMSAEYIEIAGLLALMVGSSLVLMSVLRIGKLVRYLSPAMMSGFTSAAALIIGLSQLKHLLGANLGRQIAAHEVIMAAISKLNEVSFPTLAIGLISLAIFKGLPKLNSKLPAGLIGIVSMIIVSMFLGLNEQGVTVVGEIPQGLPAMTIPSMGRLMELLTGEHSSQLIGGALSIALLAFMEAIAVGGAVAKDKGYDIKPGQELLALGASNITGAFFGAYPVAGGFSRTAVNDKAGARTPLASLVTFTVVALVVWQFTPALYHLPKATLAAMIMGAVFGLMDLKLPVRLIKENPIEATIWIATFAVTLVLGLQIGILTGVVMSFGAHAWPKTTQESTAREMKSDAVASKATSTEASSQA